MSALSGYAVVQFTEWGDGQSAEAVPVSWLMTVGRKLMCYYPKTGRKKVVKTRETPRGDWELHAVRRLTRNEIATYQTPCEKERNWGLIMKMETQEHLN